MKTPIIFIASLLLRSLTAHLARQFECQQRVSDSLAAACAHAAAALIKAGAANVAMMRRIEARRYITQIHHANTSRKYITQIHRAAADACSQLSENLKKEIRYRIVGADAAMLLRSR